MEALFTQKKTMVVAPKMDKDGRFNRNASFKSLLGPLDAEQKKCWSEKELSTATNWLWIHSLKNTDIAAK